MVMINDQQGFKNIADLMANPQCPACGEKLEFEEEEAATGQILPTFKAQHHDKDFTVDLNTMPVIVSVSPTPQPKPEATAAESKKKPSEELAATDESSESEHHAGRQSRRRSSNSQAAEE